MLKSKIKRVESRVDKMYPIEDGYKVEYHSGNSKGVAIFDDNEAGMKKLGKFLRLLKRQRSPHYGRKTCKC